MALLNHETLTENNFTTELVQFVSILLSNSTSQTEIWGLHMVVVSLLPLILTSFTSPAGKPRAHVRRRMSWARRMPLRLLVRVLARNKCLSFCMHGGAQLYGSKERSKSSQADLKDTSRVVRASCIAMFFPYTANAVRIAFPRWEKSGTAE